MSVEADPGWRIVAAATVALIYRTLPRGAQPPGQRQSDLDWPAELLREGSGRVRMRKLRNAAKALVLDHPLEKEDRREPCA